MRRVYRGEKGPSHDLDGGRGRKGSRKRWCVWTGGLEREKVEVGVYTQVNGVL